MSSKIRVGVVGAGRFGEYHTNIYAKLDNVLLVAVVDTDNNRASKVAKQSGCLGFTDPSELLGKVDAVSVAVPTTHHYSIAKMFLEQGVHVLMEKPIASTYEQGLELVKLADKNNVNLQVGHLERYNAGVRSLIDNVTSAQFIEVHRLGIFTKRSTDVDVVMDLMIHDIDIVCALAKSEIDKIDAVGVPVLTELVDIANARFEFKNGTVANVTASRVSGKKLRRIRIFAHEKYYGLDYENSYLEVVQKDPSQSESAEIGIISEKIDVEPKLPLDEELSDFIESIRSGYTPMVDGYAGLEALRIALMVKEKIELCRQKQQKSLLLT